MRFPLYLIVAASLFAFSCGGSNDESAEETTSDSSIVDKEAFMKDFNELNDKINANLETPDPALLKKAVTSYQDYAAIFPDAEDAPDYLLKASDFAYSIGQIEKSVKLLERIMDLYPAYNRMQDVMYARASHLDFELRDTTAAKTAYGEFIEKYPNSPMVLDAQSRIENISLTLEQLAEKFMKELEESGTN